MQPTRILLLRHAETAAPEFFHGAESDVGLSEWGTRQAALVGQSLAEEGAEALYCSGMRRAIATAEPIGLACGLAPTVIAALHERKIGPLSGMSREGGWEIYAESKRQWVQGNLEFTHPGGESFADIRRRILPIFEDLRSRHEGRTIVVVAHGVVIRVALTSLLESYGPGDFDGIAIEFASINDLRGDGSRWWSEAMNRVVAPSPSRPVA